MQRRGLAIFVLALQVWFLNVFIPGHTRGEFTLGSAGDASPSASCCSPSRAADSTGAPKSPTQSDREHCAVCYVAIGLTVAPPIITAPEPGGLCGIVAAVRAQRPIRPELILTYRGRAPPALHSPADSSATA